MAEYIFAGHQHDQERNRLRLIEEALDRWTFARLEQTGIAAGWRCLELGPGGGSIMKWMGDAVGTGGVVVGVDRSTSHLHELSGPPYQIVESDFLDAELNDPFDLVHCRYVLIHNLAAEKMLTRLCQLLKPGGFLVVEEPDFTSARLLGGNGSEAQQRVNNAICRMFENKGLNPRYGLDLPGKITAQGVQIVHSDAQLHVAPGGSSVARMMAASQQALADEYVATGEASDSDIEQYVRSADDRQFWTVYYCTVSIVAQKPT